MDTAMIPFELVADPAAQRNFETIARLLSTITEIPFYAGTGAPNGVVTASPPAIYFNRSGGAGTTVYLKESGSSTNTGWVGK